MLKKTVWMSVSAGLALCSAAAFADGPRANSPKKTGPVGPTAAATAKAGSLDPDAEKQQRFQAWKEAHQAAAPQTAAPQATPGAHGFRAPPANDECDNAVILACDETASVDLSEATSNGSDPIGTCVGATHFNNTVWYRAVVPASGSFTLATCGSPLDTTLTVFSGSCAGLNQIGCNDDACGLQSRVTVNAAAAGTTVYIMLALYTVNANPNTITLTYACIGPPTGNDSINGATPITLPASVSGDTTSASIDTSDVPAAACGTTISAPGVWYRMTGNGQSITATTCNNHPYDTKLNVYCGQPGTLSCVAGNDDSCGLGSSLTFCSQPAATYYILVQGYNNQTGAFTLDVTADGAPCTAVIACLPQGACCVGTVCSIMTQGACTAANGAYRGNSTNCSGLPTSAFTSNPNIPITDFAGGVPGGATDTLTVTGGPTVADLNVRVNVTHTFIGDLIITLTSPNNTAVVLWGRSCGVNDNLDVTFDDTGNPVACASPTTGVIIPNGTGAGMLSEFNGQASNGAWTLGITDNAGLDVGTLVSWGLDLNSTTPCTTGGNPCPADFDASGEVNANDISAYLNAWYNDIVGGTLVADYDHNGETNANDISAYINAWYAAIINGGTC